MGLKMETIVRLLIDKIKGVANYKPRMKSSVGSGGTFSFNIIKLISGAGEMTVIKSAC